MSPTIAEMYGFNLDIARKSIDDATLRETLKNGPICDDYDLKLKVPHKPKWVYGERPLSTELCEVMSLTLEVERAVSQAQTLSLEELHCGHFLMAVLVRYSTNREILSWLYAIGITKHRVDDALRSNKSSHSLWGLNQLQVVHGFNNIVNLALKRREWRDLADYMKIARIGPTSMRQLASKLGINHAEDIEDMATKNQWAQAAAYCEVFGINPSNSDIPFDRIVPHC